jgi:hypothetical protein
MKLRKLSLSLAVFAGFCLLQIVPAWGTAIPKKSPSEYGDAAQQVELTTPAFTPISQDGVNISLDSVFCTVDACAGDPTAPDPTGQQLSYFFKITLGAGSQLDSLTFGPDFNDFGVTIFDGTFTCASGHTCVPGSSDGLNFNTVDLTLAPDCSSSGCTVNLLNFNTATIGTGTIFFAAGTPLNSVLNVNGVAQTPLLSIKTSTTTVSVPEPSSAWFAAIACLFCFGVALHRKKQLIFAN